MTGKLKKEKVYKEHVSGIVFHGVGDENIGKTLKRFDSKMNTDTEPTTGTYCSPSCPAFSSNKSLIPNPVGFVSSISAICCAAPGLSTDNRDRSHRAPPIPIRKTTNCMTTASDIGEAASSPLLCRAWTKERAKPPNSPIITHL